MDELQTLPRYHSTQAVQKVSSEECNGSAPMTLMEFAVSVGICGPINSEQ